MAGTVGVRLKALREFYGWSQRELAKRAGVPNSAISVIEQGSVSPSIVSLEKVLKGFPLTLSDFFSINIARHNSKVCHEETDSVATSLFASFHGDVAHASSELTLRCFERGPNDSPVNLMARGQTLILLARGEVMYRSLGVEHHMICGSSLSLFSVAPYRIDPLMPKSQWVIASIPVV